MRNGRKFNEKVSKFEERKATNAQRRLQEEMTSWKQRLASFRWLGQLLQKKKAAFQFRYSSTLVWLLMKNSTTVPYLYPVVLSHLCCTSVVVVRGCTPLRSAAAVVVSSSFLLLARLDARSGFFSCLCLTLFSSSAKLKFVFIAAAAAAPCLSVWLCRRPLLSSSCNGRLDRMKSRRQRSIRGAFRSRWHWRLGGRQSLHSNSNISPDTLDTLTPTSLASAAADTSQQCFHSALP